MKAAFYTLGCKVNQNETAALVAMFREAGFTVVPETENADVYVVNSCTVTAGGDAKSRQWLRRARRRNPHAVTVLTGCFPQAFPQQAAIPEADIVTGTTARTALVALVQARLNGAGQVVRIEAYDRDTPFEELPTAAMEGRTRAFVKIQDGCNRRCAYCIIPTARGHSRSRSQNSILAELETLGSQGYAEVVFTGINLPSYGKDTGTSLGKLVSLVDKVPGIRRVRLSSLEPDLIPPDQIELFARSEKLCGHFHLSLQSGSDATLRRMRRAYSSGQFASAAQALRQAMPGCSLTTDIIVGFPGETETEFAESMEFVQRMEFLKVHVFPFSARPGTPAARFDEQIPKAEKANRAGAMQAAADEVRAAWMEKERGSRQQVLLETPLPDGRFTGYTGNYIPVATSAPGAQQGQIVTVTLGGFDGEHCTATCPHEGTL